MKEDQDKNNLSKSAQNSSNPETDSERTETKRQGQAVRQAELKQVELRHAAPQSAWRRLLAKKWVFPAVYLAAAAIILSLMWTFQGKDDNALTETDMHLSLEESTGPDVTHDDDALPVVVSAEEMEWPVAEPEWMTVIRPFYDENASNEVKQAAMIRYENMFMPSTGIALVSNEQEEPFDVLAALSGTVTRVDNLPLVGNIVELEHEDGLKTIYHSLANVAVEEGAQVVQGEVIAQAGRSEIGKDFGTHLHFEVHKDGEPVNPEHYLPVIAQTNSLPRDVDEAAEVDSVETGVSPDADSIGDPAEDPDAGARDEEMDDQDVETEIELDE